MSNPVIDSKGTHRWYNSEGEYHRLDGPAIEGADGSKQWWVNGKLHRLDGPAVEWYNGLYVISHPSEWWIDNVKVTKSEYPEAVLLYKCKMVLES